VKLRRWIHLRHTIVRRCSVLELVLAVQARPGPRAPVETGNPFSWNVDSAGPLLVPPVTG